MKKISELMALKRNKINYGVVFPAHKHKGIMRRGRATKNTPEGTNK